VIRVVFAWDRLLVWRLARHPSGQGQLPAILLMGEAEYVVQSDLNSTKSDERRMDPVMYDPT
jgi:hypothetical protein